MSDGKCVCGEINSRNCPVHQVKMSEHLWYNPLTNNMLVVGRNKTRGFLEFYERQEDSVYAFYERDLRRIGWVRLGKI